MTTAPDIVLLSVGFIFVASVPLTSKVQLIPLLSVHSAAHAWDIPQSKRVISNSFFIFVKIF